MTQLEQEIKNRKAAEMKCSDLQEQFRELVLTISKHPDFRRLAGTSIKKTLENARGIVGIKEGKPGENGDFYYIPGAVIPSEDYVNGDEYADHKISGAIIPG